MTCHSSDLQKACAQLLSHKKIPEGFIKIARSYNPRLGHLLASANKNVFESDLKLFAEFLQTHPSAHAYSPNRYIRPFDVYQKLKTNIRQIQRQKAAQKEEKSAQKAYELKKHLTQLERLTAHADPESRKRTERVLKKLDIYKRKTPQERHARAKELVNEISGLEDVLSLSIKQRNIKRSRKLTERRERVDELLEALRNQKSRQGNGALSSSVHAEAPDSVLKTSDLV